MMVEQDQDDDLENRLKRFGWSRGPHTLYPDGTVKLRLRCVGETSGQGERTIVGKDLDHAIRKEVERLEAEGAAGVR
jgi:hypothetical protein